MAEAKRLLLSTDLTVAETARAVDDTNEHQSDRVARRSCSMSLADDRRWCTRADGEVGG